MTVAELRDSARRVLGVDLPVEPPNGEGPHALRRIAGQNTRQADRYRAGNIFLLGDSAHVHSAMGGPGLNLGLQDAMNLGWKLAAAVNGWAPEDLLDTYHSERYPVGERVMMHSMSQTALFSPGPEIAALRELFKELLQQPSVAEHMAHLLAGSDVRYDIGDDHRLAGRLVPDLTLDDGRRVVDLLRRGRPMLLDLSGGYVGDAAWGWLDRVDVVDGAVADLEARALLIRPDGYVAWAADTFDRGDAGAIAGRAASGGSVSASQSAAHNAGMTGDLRTQQQSEQRDGQPGPQVRADPRDPPGLVEVEHHRIGDRHACDSCGAHRDPGRSVADDLLPRQAGEPAVDGVEKNPKVVTAAKDHPARQRRDQLRVGRERAHHGIDVMAQGRLEERGYRIFRLRYWHAITLTSFIAKSNGLF